MPFTFSHPALVLPLKYLPPKYISMTALIIGSLLPDFEYFLRVKLFSEHSHTLLGVFYFDLPLGILLAFIYHNVVRNSLIDNLPSFLKSRFVSYKDFDWNGYFRRNVVVICISFLIGIFSHLLWDSFTHGSGFFVELFPFLKGSVYLFHHQIPIFKILQQLSTFTGAFIIVIFVIRTPVERVTMRKSSWIYWVIWVILFSILFALRLLFHFTTQIGHLVVITISAGMLSIILTSIIWILYTRKNIDKAKVVY